MTLTEGNDIPQPIHEDMEMGFADLTRDIRDRFVGIDGRLDAIELRLDAIEAHLRRIYPNDHQP